MYIKTFTQMIQVLETMSGNLPTYAAALGTTPADQAFLDTSLPNAVAIQNYCDEMDTNKKAYFAIKQRFYNGEQGAIPEGPVTGAFAPGDPLMGDTHGQLMKLIGRIVDANGYSETIGVALGIAGESGEPQNPAELKLTLEAFPGQSDYNLAVVVGNRGGIDMWELEVQPATGGEWTNLGRYDGKGQDITYAPAPGVTGPVQINLRARTWKGGKFVGLFSDIVTVTLNP